MLAPSTLEEMAQARVMVDHERLDARAGGPGSSSTGAASTVFVGHGGAMPGHLAALVVHRPRASAAAVLTNTGAGAAPEKLALDLAVAAIEALPAATEAWQPAEPVPPDVLPLLGPWWVEGHEIVLALAQGPARGEAARRPARP